eukprot:5159606-Amphidinium_carterae.1
MSQHRDLADATRKLIAASFIHTLQRWFRQHRKETERKEREQLVSRWSAKNFRKAAHKTPRPAPSGLE